jgi:cytochrome c oxidase assembly factor CtaG
LLHVEHVMYLAAGFAVWWPVVHGTQSAGAKAAYLFAAFVLASPLGLLLALIPRPVYSFYAHAPRTWGPGPLVDQQVAGVTMAVEQAVVFFAVFAYYLLRFLRDEEAAGALLTTSTAPERRRAADGFARPRH